MKLTSLSATAAQVFESCEARWRAERIDWAGSPTSKAAGLGTVCHAALEEFVRAGLEDDEPKMIEFYTKAYEEMFADRMFYDEGLKLVRSWMRRQIWSGRKVLSTEQKENFKIPTSVGDIPFNYIWDRCDQLADGSIEIVDYKTNQAALTHEQLSHNVQARCYGLAAQIKYPWAERVWVTFDYLRHQPVGVVFTKEQNGETWRYLRRLAERIIASDGTTETLNDQCRWCVRRHECKALKAHVNVGGALGLTDPIEAANRRRELDAARQALSVMIDELDQVLLAHLDELEEGWFETDETKVRIEISSRRHIDHRSAASILGGDIMAAYAELKMEDVDRLLRGTELDPSQKDQLRELIYPKLGVPRIKTEKVAVL